MSSYYKSCLLAAVTISAVTDLPASSVGSASETATYRYDALGRLKAAEHRRTGGNGYEDQYIHDAASNRTRLEGSGPFVGSSLPWHGSLQPGQSMLSPDGRFKLTLQRDGNVVLYNAANGVLWMTGTVGSGANWLVLQNDGNLVLYTGQTPVWATNTNGQFSSHLEIQSDGNLVLYRADNVVLWQSGTCCQ
jgi:YD repeat-containing protein